MKKIAKIVFFLVSFSRLNPAGYGSEPDQMPKDVVRANLFLAVQKNDVAFLRSVIQSELFKKCFSHIDEVRDNLFGRKKLLLYAAEINNGAIMQELLFQGSDPNQEYNGFTPLYYAALNGNTLAVRALLKAGAHVNGFKWVPLIIALKNGNIEVVRTLIHSDADIRKQNPVMETALSVARSLNNPQILDEVMSRKIKIGGIKP